MGLGGSKKAMVFTILAIIISIFFTTLFSARISQSLNAKQELLITRISIMETYIEDFFRYAKGVGSMTGYSAMQGIIEDMNDTKTYKPNFENEFISCVLTGNITNTKKCPGMENKTMSYYLDMMKSIADPVLHINTTYIINNATISQKRGKDAFIMDLDLNITLRVRSDYANITATRIITSPVTIIGLQDPLYLLNGTYTQTIKKYEQIAGKWNYIDLQNMYNKSLYRSSVLGISIIRRIKGDYAHTGIDEHGIESIVNYTRVGYDEHDSLIDHYYWQKIKLSCEAPEGDNPEVVGIDEDIMPLKGSQFFQLDYEHVLSFSLDYPIDYRMPIPGCS